MLSFTVTSTCAKHAVDVTPRGVKTARIKISADYALSGDMKVYERQGAFYVCIALYPEFLGWVNRILFAFFATLRLRPFLVGPSISRKWKYLPIRPSEDATATFMDIGVNHSIVPVEGESATHVIRSEDQWGHRSIEGTVHDNGHLCGNRYFGVMSLASLDLLVLLFPEDASPFALSKALGLKPVLKIADQVRAKALITTNPSTGYGISISLAPSGDGWVVTHTDSGLVLGYIFNPRWISVEDGQIALTYSTYGKHGWLYRQFRNIKDKISRIIWRLENIRIPIQKGFCKTHTLSLQEEAPLLSVEWGDEEIKIKARVLQDNRHLYIPVGEVTLTQGSLPDAERILFEKIILTMYALIIYIEQHGPICGRFCTINMIREPGKIARE